MKTIYSDYYPIFLYVDKYRFSKNWLYTDAKVPYSLIRYILSGTVSFFIDGKRYDAGRDDVVYIPQGSILGGVANEDLVFISIRFIDSVQIADADMLQILWDIPVLYSFSGDNEMRSYFEKVYANALTRNTFKMLNIRGYLNLICAKLAQISRQNYGTDVTVEEDRRQMEQMEARFDMQSIKKRAQKSARAKNDPRIAIVLDALTTYPQENFTTRKLCEFADLSESTLRRLFKEQTGKTLYEFMKENKMNYAARKLLVTNDAISSIAYELGYESPSYFAKCFKGIFGISPQEYRKTSQGM